MLDITPDTNRPMSLTKLISLVATIIFSFTQPQEVGCYLTEVIQNVEGVRDSFLMWRKTPGETGVTIVEPWLKTYCVPSVFIEGKWVIFHLERLDPSDIKVKVVAMDKTGLRIPTQPPPILPHV